jgi:replicative superfamily II helicase
MVIAAPTGSGKTGILDLCLLRYFNAEVIESVNRRGKKMSEKKALYLAPLK